MEQRNYRTVLFISITQFGMSFSFTYVMVFIPFYVYKISPYASQQTLIWIGLVMSAPPLVAALASTFWGLFTARFNPKALYMAGLFSHAILFFLMGFVDTLSTLLFLRILQGILGGVSTVGLVIVSSSSSSEMLSRDIGLFQNCMTFGQLAGPPMGALAASAMGYSGAFISASILVFLTIMFFNFNVSEILPQPAGEGSSMRGALDGKSLAAWTLCFAAAVQLMFLPSVIPDIFRAFHIERSIALRWAGAVIMLYTATAIVGTYILCKLPPRVSRHRLIMAIVLAGTFLQAMLSVPQDVFWFVALRMFQTALIAPVLPLVFSVFRAELKGGVIGFLNSGRFAGVALGPLVATSVLAISNLTVLFLLISGMTLAALAGFTVLFKEEGRTP